MNEIWKPVASLENKYEVSSLGNVRRAVGGQATQAGRLIVPMNNRGYARFAPSVNGKQCLRTVHRLVVEAFIGDPRGMQINHRNGIKHDNRLENLEVCTAAENTRHKFEVLGYPMPKPPPSKGEENGRAKLNDACARAIKILSLEGWTQTRIAELFGVSQTSISRVLLGKTGFNS
jgi:hypothetical protein